MNAPKHFVRRRRRHKSPGDADSAAEVDATKKYPLLVVLHGGRRRCGKFVGLPVELAGFFRGGVRDADDQPARLDRLWTKVHG